MKFKQSLWIVFFISFLLTNTLTPASAQSKFEKIDAFVKQFHDYKQFNGAVLVSQNGKIILEKGYGLADFEWGIENTPSTKFRIGSITKQFTSMLIMQLVQEGKISLDAPITQYLKNYRKDTGDKVTVHHLLAHTSGIPSYTSQPGFFKDVSRDPYTVEEFTSLFCSNDLEFEPGSEFKYNNSGYFLLGNIIEQVSGQTYEQALEERILKPLGMKNTGYDSSSKIIKNRASGYENTLDGLVNAHYLDMSLPYAAGSMYSTVQDLMIWDSALYSEKLLSKALIEKMYQVTEHRNYGYGWSIDKLSADDFGTALTNINHGGGINGFNTYISRIIEDRYLIVLLNNTGGAPLTPMNKGIINILYSKAYETPKQDINRVLYEKIKAEGIDSAIAKYHDIQSTGEEISERSINHLGYELLNLKMVDEAIAIFTLNVETKPDSPNAHDSLAEAYLLNKNSKLALMHYQKSLELDSDNNNAKTAIENLKAALDKEP